MDLDVVAGSVATLKKNGYKVLEDAALRRILRTYGIADVEVNDPDKAKHTETTQRFRVQLVTVGEICYFHSDTKYTRVVTASREALIRMSLKELLDMLDPAEFWQVHRSTIVNVNAIAEVSRDARGFPVLHLKHREESLQVSQPFAHLFRQM